MSIDLDRLRPQIAELCAKYGIAELAVFGSGGTWQRFSR